MENMINGCRVRFCDPKILKFITSSALSFWRNTHAPKSQAFTGVSVGVIAERTNVEEENNKCAAFSAVCRPLLQDALRNWCKMISTIRSREEKKIVSISSITSPPGAVGY